METADGDLAKAGTITVSKYAIQRQNRRMPGREFVASA